jgi:hypothetical protein
VTVRRGPGLVGLGLAASLVLVGCSAPTLSGGTGGTGGSGGTAGGTTTETFTSDTESVPETFPAAVPLIEGDVVLGLDMGTGWTVILGVSDTAAARTDADARLLAAGFAYVSGTADGAISLYASSQYQVQFIVDLGVDGATATYVVTPA